ncbi:MAG: sulfite exporter TauE/SafE family protein [Hydrogenophilales bacterium]|nr:sulfite exporter TauE/SafE family protein [Hydrogenophilales bacterium]
MFEMLTPIQLLAGAAIIAIAYLVRGIAGFGSGLIAIPLLVFIMPISTVVPLILVLDYLASIGMGMSSWREICWKEVLSLLPFSFIGTIVAFFFLQQIDTDILTKALGVFIIVFGLYSLSGHTPQVGAARAWGIWAGLSGGVVHVLFGTGGPFYVTYFKARGIDKAAFRATLAAVFMIDGAGRLIGFGATGHFSLGFLYLLAVAVPLMAVFLYAGGHIHTRLTQAAFQRAISTLLVGSGAILLMR